MSFLLEFGLPELLVVLVIIFIFFGPGRLGKFAGQPGKGNRSSQEELFRKKDEKK
jgi:Sec-independent protein translocase protein TatA